MIRVLVIVMIWGMWAPLVAADARPQGLMWHRSGLAATLPLQVKTHAGADYVLTLYDPDAEKAVLAAYIRGGAFFRVLVPPGRYVLQFASGTDWQGEADLFGAQTAFFELTPALTFRATATRKEGHLIDLRDHGGVDVRALADCQRWELDPESLRGPRFDLSVPETGRPKAPDRFPVRDYNVRGRICG